MSAVRRSFFSCWPSSRRCFPEYQIARIPRLGTIASTATNKTACKFILQLRAVGNGALRFAGIARNFFGSSCAKIIAPRPWQRNELSFGHDLEGAGKRKVELNKHYPDGSVQTSERLHSGNDWRAGRRACATPPPAGTPGVLWFCTLVRRHLLRPYSTGSIPQSRPHQTPLLSR